MLLSLRWHGRIFFKHAAVRIHSFWPRQEGVIRVRWSIHAVPRIPWEAEGIFDGVSEYKLDRYSPQCFPQQLPAVHCHAATGKSTSIRSTTSSSEIRPFSDCPFFSRSSLPSLSPGLQFQAPGAVSSKTKGATICTGSVWSVCISFFLLLQL